MREHIYSVIRRAEAGDRLGKIYDIFIVAVAFISIAPLMFKTSGPILDAVDLVTVYILFADYIFRWMTCDYAGKTKGVLAFVKYPFTPLAILDLVSLLPSMGLVSPGLRMLRVFRIFKVLYYSQNFRYVAKVFGKEKKTLFSVMLIAIFYIFVSALTMFSYEPETFDSFFDALYWATTALTTVGYGDFYPVSEIGKLISMISSLFGVAIIALPAGIMAAGFVDAIHNNEHPSESAVAPEPLKTERPVIFTASSALYAIIMLAGVAVNTVFSIFAQVLGLPVWLDVTGTAFTAILLGPSAGLIVGLINNFILAAFEFGASSLFYYAVSASVALITGLCLKKGGKLSLGRILPVTLLIIVVSGVLSAGIDLWITWGQAPDSYWERFYYEAAFAAGVPHVPSCFLGALTVKVFDTAASGMLIALLYCVTPKKLRQL